VERRWAVTNHGLIVVGLAIILLGSGCKDFAGPEDSTQDVSGSASLAVSGRGESVDETFARLATQVPGFGGFFFDESGRLNTYIKDPARAPRLKDVIRPVLAARDVAAVEGMQVRQGRYDFRELLQWKELATEVLALPGVILIDIDETQNLLRIGVESAALDQSVQEQLASVSIPREAVTVEVVEPVTFAAGPREAVTVEALESVTPVAATIRDWLPRPLDGGIQIYNYTECTMGFNAKVPSDPAARYFVVASHCTGSRFNGGVESSAFYQNTQGGANRIGTETSDPLYTPGIPGCPSGKRCRRSDSALVRYDNASFSNYPYIVRTIGTSQTQGSIQINSSNPRFRITGEGSPFVGLFVDKIGRTTAWTWGQVTLTCVTIKDIQDPATGQLINNSLLCQSGADAGSTGGDSGAPVFRWSGSGSNITLFGLYWGRQSSGRYWFSPIANVEGELGSLDTF
jgi:hypothetical protein